MSADSPRMKPGARFTKTVWLLALPTEYSPGDPIPVIYDSPLNDNGFIAVTSAEVVFNIPADYNPLALEIAVIEEEKLKALEAFQKTTRVLNERLSKLQAITYNEEPARA
jgi:hypothetical protein